MNSTKVKITSPTFIGGQPVKVGDVIAVSETDANNLLAGGKAVPVDKAAAKAGADREARGEGGSTR